MNKYLSTSSAIRCLMGCVFSLSAQPSGMEVMSGSVDLASPQPHMLQIQASDRAIIQWDSFSIGAGEMTRFVLPDAASAVLNRVTGSQMSELMGVLQSNGQIFLINPQGVFVGPDATINTASFIASTFDVLNEDFLAKADLLFQGDSTASIVNLGTISTQMGDVILLARYIDNQGSIEAPQGTAALGAGTRVLLKPADSTKIYIETSIATGTQEGVGIHNQGNIQALLVELQADGNPYQHAIRHDGRLDALGVAERNGRILLIADEGQVYITGHAKATAAEQIAPDAGVEAYGEITVCADDIVVTDQASFDVSNELGGGLIRLGFERQEDGPRARGLWTGKEVQFNADATLAGNGGRVLLWGGDAHVFLSNITARGGSVSGDGGFVEVSTKGFLLPEGLVNTLAANGATGTLLYDPTDITITDTPPMDDNVTIMTIGSTTFFRATVANNPARISNGTLVSNLTMTNVDISTASTGMGMFGDITVGRTGGPVSISWGAATTLKLFANRNIQIFGQVNATGGGAIDFTANGDIIFTSNMTSGGALLQTSSGNITLLAGSNITMSAPTGLTGNLIQTTSSGNILLTTANLTPTNPSLISLNAGGAGGFSSITTLMSGNITIVASGGPPGALELIAGTAVGGGRAAEIVAAGTGNVTITTGLPVDVLGFGTGTPGSVTLSPGGQAAGQNAQITAVDGTLTLNILRGDLTINGGTGTTNDIFGRVAKLGSAAASGMSVFVDGNITIGPTNGPPRDPRSMVMPADSPFGIYMKTPNSPFNLTVSGNVMTTMTTGTILIGTFFSTGLIGNSITTISILGKLTMSALSNGQMINRDIRNFIFGNNGMTLNVGGDAFLTSQGGLSNPLPPVAGFEAYAMIGTQNINLLNVTIGGNLTLMNTALNSNAGESQILSESTGGSHVTVNGSITLTGSTATISAPAGVGNCFIGCSQGPLVVTCAEDIIMTAGAWQADVHIGYPYVAGGFSSPITVNTNNLIMNAGPGIAGAWVPVCLIGTGQYNNFDNRTATAVITVNATGTVSLIGASTLQATAIIGHVGNQFMAQNPTLAGDIRVQALNVVMNATQNVPDSFVQIGHGSASAFTPLFAPYTITVIADRNIVMTSVGSATLRSRGTSQIWNRNISPPDNAITVICDNASQTAPDYGTGFFSFGTGSIIFAGSIIAPMTPGAGQVRIYTSVRIFNTVTTMGPGQYASLPINGSSPGVFPEPGVFPAPLGTNTSNEVWGAWANPAVPGGGADYPVGTNFVIYYKRVGGILISNLPTSDATVGLDTTFALTESYIPVANVLAALGAGSVGINVETLPTTMPPTAAPTNNILNGNSILWRRVPAVAGNANLTWTNTNSLTLTAGNDVVVKDATISTTVGTTANSITILAGRDCVIGTRDQASTFNAIVQVTGGARRINIVTGRDLLVGASGLSLGGNARILDTGGSIGLLTIGRDLIIRANADRAEVSLSSLTATIGRNCIQNGGGATNSFSLFLLANTSTVSMGGYHSLNGGSGSSAYAQFDFGATGGGQTLTYTSNGGLYLTGGSGIVGLNALGGASALFTFAGSGASVNITVPNGNVILNGGAGGGAYIQPRVASSMPLNLNVPNGSLILQGNQLGSLNATIDTIFKYGAAAIFTRAGSTGPITITVGGDVRLIGGNGPGTFATIGNPLVTGTTGAITINVAGNLIQQGGGTAVIPSLSLGAGAGTGPNTVAQIFTGATGLQPVTLQVGGDYLVTGGPGFASAAGVFTQNAQMGTLSVTVGGDMILTGGAHTNAVAACIWNRSTAGITSTITVGNATARTGDLILRSGTGYGASAFLSLPDAAAQNQNITCAGNLVLTSDASAPGFSFAGITGGTAVIHSLSIGGNVTITANGNNPAFVGSGNPALTGSYTGTITFNSIGGDLMLNGSTLLGVIPAANTAFPLPNFTRGFAQIGHVNGATVAGTIAGDITIMATGSVIQNGGRNPGGYAQIGHGGYAKTLGTDTYSPCIVKVFAGRNIVMYTSIAMSVASPGPAQTVNYATGTDSSITLVTDNNYPNPTPPESGPGFFYFSLDSQILTGLNGTVNPDTQVSIYTSSRIFNTVIGPINGTSLPITTLDVTNPLEQWCVYAETGTYPITMPSTPFQFYYKRIGGLVISPDRGDNGVIYDDGVYTFYLAEATINSLNLSSNLGLVSVLIDSNGLNASPCGSSANSILIESSNPLVPNPIGWGNTNTLTINSSQDLVLNNTIASSSTGFSTDSTGITLNAARNIFIGDGTEVVPTGISSASAPINVTALGSIGLYGGAAANAAVLLSNMGPGNTHLTASNGGVTLRGGGVDSTSVLIAQNVGDIIIDVLEGDFNMRGGSADNTFTEMNTPTTPQDNNVVVTVSTGNAYMVGGSGASSYSAIFNNSSGVNGGSIRFSVLQGNFVAQAGSENQSFVQLSSVSPGVLHVDVAGDLTMKGFGDSIAFSSGEGEGIYNVGGNLLMRAGSIVTSVSQNSVQLSGNPLTVTVGGSITMIAQNNNYVVIGNAATTLGSDISVTACAGISLQGEISGQQSDTLGYAKIGHFTDIGGIWTLAGNIDVTAGDAVTLKAGSFNGARLAGTVPPSQNQSVAPIIPTASAAQIGLGRNVTGGVTLTASGATTINARALTIQAGLGAQGGSASVFSSGAPSLALNLSAGDLYIQSGGSTGSSATAIAREGSTMIPGGSVTATVSNGNILLLAGVGSGASVDIPNTAALTNGSGTTSVTCAGSLTITGGLGSNSNASIGIVSLDEALTVNVGSDVVMTSGFGANSYANIGCITPMMMTTSPITLTAGGNVLLTAAGYGYAKIGHGFVTVTTSPSWSATISVTAGGDIVLSGTGGSNLGTTGGVPIAGGGLGFSQIGHTNSQSVVTSILGDIQVTAGGSLLLNPGLKSTAYARIGHGGVAKLPGVLTSDVYHEGTIHVLCGENVYMLNSDSLRLAQAGNAVVWGQLSQIVNLCLSPAVDSIWIVTDQNHPTLPDAGTGHFVFTSNAFVASRPPMASAQRVKIYTAVRVFNFLPAGSQVNGLPPYTVNSLPVSIPASAGGEAWGYSYATDATNPITIGLNYEIYYKRVGGITLSGDATTGTVMFVGNTYLFPSTAEAVINTTLPVSPNLRGALMADATVNAANLEGTSDPNNSILFRRTWNTGVMDPRMDQSTLSWSDPTQLTLSAPQDIAIDATMSSSGPSLMGAAIVLTAGRDVLVETCGLNGNIISANSAPITITAGQDYRSKGPSLGFTSNAQIYSAGPGAVAVTAGRDVAMIGGAYVGTALQYPPSQGESQSIEAPGGGITVTATTGSVLMRGGYGSPAGLSSSAPIAVHAAQDIVMQGGSGGLHSFVEIRNGAIITPNAIVMTAGGNIYMLGGLGLAPAPSDVGVRVQSLSGGISITAGGSIAMTASPSISSLPILPIDTTQSPGVVVAVFGTQPIVIRSGGDLTMTSSPGGGEAGIWVLIGSLIDLSIGGNLTINSANLPLALLLLNQNLAVAHIGGNGPLTTPTVLIRNVNGNLTLNGNRNSYATIGGNSVNIPEIYTGNITIQNVDGYVTLNAYNGPCNNDYGFVQIGVPNNRTILPSVIDSTVTIAAQQDITLNGGSTPSAFARIGNGGQPTMTGDFMQGDVSLFSGYGNLTLNSNTGGAAIAAFTNMTAGSITTIIAGNTTLNGSSTITSQTGPITLLTGVSQILNDSSSISNASPLGISIVADNLYPTPPDFGLGRILTAFNSSISTPGPLRLYSAAQQINIVSGLINSQRFTPGPLNINSAVEQWFKYYPQFFGGFPYIFFYKTSLQGMILDATVANSTLTQFLPLAVPIIRVETKPVDETKESEET